MNKNELAQEIAVSKRIPISTVHIMLDAILDNIVSQMMSGNSVTIYNFGTFERVQLAARKGVNPRTLQPIEVPVRYGVRFVASRKLKAKVNEEQK